MLSLMNPRTLAIALACVTLAGCASTNRPTPHVGTVKAAIILPTGSMAPTLTAWQYYNVIAVPYADLQPGDIVIRHSKWTEVPLTHRIIHRSFSGDWITKGDANSVVDPDWLTPANYIGVIRP